MKPRSRLHNRFLFRLLIVVAGVASACCSALAEEPARADATATAEPSPSPYNDFPKRGILPKAEIGALEFLEKYPEYDGRGVIVAIFDTGVDPGAAGLAKTTDGKTKVIDMIDGTGAGDVLTTTVREPTDGTLEGLTGRKLTLSSAWKNPTGRYHVGIKRGYDFFPGELVLRLKEERRKTFDKAQWKTESSLRHEIFSFLQAHPKPSPDEAQQLAELNARLKALRAVAKNFDDPGPLYDCVVFHDGTVWRAVVDTDEDGDLAEERLLMDYRRERQFATFGSESELNFAVNIFEKGKRLSLVTDCGAHGTHVAGIVAGHFPDQPELNGIAPGAQIVSVKIGDPRIGGMETASGFERGLAAVIRNKCDLINMSYGEPTTTPDRGWLTSQFSDIVNKHGVIFVSSAGNSGPALTTVGAPGGSTSALIGVGAYVSPQMMEAEYTLRTTLPGMPYTWTSRGPTADGDLGIDIFAPGGAIAPIPNWTLRRARLMNGTSMASPNACGGIALLLSGMKLLKKPYSPHSVRRALANTARKIDGAEPFAQGPGLLNVVQAFGHLDRNASAVAETMRFRVDLPNRKSARGLYLREPFETRRPHNVTVRVRPIFKDDDDNADKVNLELRLDLEATNAWVSVGQSMLMTHGEQTFRMQVDPTRLPPGAHFAEVLAYEAGNRQRGPLFRLPITVIRSSDLTSEENQSLEERLTLSPGQAVRRFVAVPESAAWADLTLRSHTGDGNSRRFVVHPVQRLSGESLKNLTRTREYIRLKPETEAVRSFPVVGGHTLELCLAQYWSSLGEAELQYRLTFRSLQPDKSQITLDAGQPVARVELSASSRNIRIAPAAVLKTHRKLVAPSSARIRPLDAARDTLPDGWQVSQLLLTYKFSQEQPGKVTPRFPDIDGLLYDSPLGGHMWMLFDAGKRRVAVDDVWPSPVHLSKGQYVLQLQLRHVDVEELERRKQTLLAIDRPLARSISLGISASRTEALGKNPKFASRTLEADEQIGLYVVAPPKTRIPAGVKPGDQLLGNVTYGSANSSLSGAGRRPGGYLLRYVVPGSAKSAATPATTSKSNSAERPASKEAARIKSFRDFEIAQLKQMPPNADSSEFDAIYNELRERYPEHLPLLAARLRWLDQESVRKERLQQIVAAADAVLAKIDTAALAAHFGTRVAPDDRAALKQRKQMTDLRETLVDTLYRKGRGLGYQELPDVIEKHPVADPEALDAAFDENFRELQKWADTTERKYFLLHVRRERRAGRYGSALEVLNKHINSDSPNYWHFKKRAELYDLLGWRHCAEYEAKWRMIRFPSTYESF